MYQGVLWSRFKFLELTEIVRVNGDNHGAYRFAQLLSRARTAWTGVGPDGVPHAHFRDEDVALLRTRLCCAHCPAAELLSFRDVQRVRMPGTYRDIERPHTVHHCAMAPGASVLASRYALAENQPRL